MIDFCASPRPYGCQIKFSFLQEVPCQRCIPSSWFWFCPNGWFFGNWTSPGKLWLWVVHGGAPKSITKWHCTLEAKSVEILVYILIPVLCFLSTTYTFFKDMLWISQHSLQRASQRGVKTSLEQHQFTVQSCIKFWTIINLSEHETKSNKPWWAKLISQVNPENDSIRDPRTSPNLGALRLHFRYSVTLDRVYNSWEVWEVFNNYILFLNRLGAERWHRLFELCPKHEWWQTSWSWGICHWTSFHFYQITRNIHQSAADTFSSQNPRLKLLGLRNVQNNMETILLTEQRWFVQEETEKAHVL